ncbi:hypothetical protein OF377_00455 [Ureaplasma sp. ES3154-GEN]|uniref:hypothetical protein n=1 Tax=Ureaplasma sp. ES3154-GEN TaxID=2984844 RepID=UPI0021E886DA|nr:hypothetical protein [Ureaplasma sp. ES3154-GEN]MCV3743358.1 hypothetical protein [Ureaplasma sp. ES3154-GEN]
MHLLEQQIITYNNSLKTNEMIKKFFRQNKLDEKITKNAKIGLFTVVGIFILAICLLIAGAFIKTGKTWLNNPGAITVMVLGIFFLLTLMIPFFVVAHHNTKLVKRFIQKYFNHSTINLFYKKISYYLKDWTFYETRWEKELITYKFNYLNINYQLIVKSNEVILKQENSVISSQLTREWQTHDDHLFVFYKPDAGFYKTYPTKCIDYLASQLNYKMQAIIKSFVKLIK